MLVEARAVHHEQPPEATTGSPTPENQNSSNLIEFMPIASKKWAERKIQNNPNLPQEASAAQLLLLWRLWKIAAHEEAHAHVIRELGGTVKKRSVIPEGNSSGRTEFTPPSRRITTKSDILALCIFYIASAAASEYGEEMIGEHNHTGCTGDRGMINHFATLCEIYTGGTYTKEYAESEGRRQSRIALCSLPQETLEYRADHLTDVLEEAA